MLGKMLLSVCFAGIIGMAWGDGNCLAYTHSGEYILDVPCIWPSFCCGDCNNVYCCIWESQRISDLTQRICNVSKMSPGALAAIVGGVGVLLILTLVICCCCCCTGCLFSRRSEAQPTYVNVQDTSNGQANYGQYLYPPPPQHQLPQNAGVSMGQWHG